MIFILKDVEDSSGYLHRITINIEAAPDNQDQQNLDERMNASQRARHLEGQIFFAVLRATDRDGFP